MSLAEDKVRFVAALQRICGQQRGIVLAHSGSQSKRLEEIEDDLETLTELAELLPKIRLPCDCRDGRIYFLDGDGSCTCDDCDGKGYRE